LSRCLPSRRHDDHFVRRLQIILFDSCQIFILTTVKLRAECARQEFGQSSRRQQMEEMHPPASRRRNGLACRRLTAPAPCCEARHAPTVGEEISPEISQKSAKGGRAMSEKSLDGRKALVTGGARGIGAAIAQALARS